MNAGAAAVERDTHKGNCSLLKRTFQTALLVLAAASFLLPLNAHGQRVGRRQATRPQFSDYAVREIFRGRPARVRLDSRRARNFRTVLREGAQTGPNFAGHYTAVQWGCGTGCAQMGIVDAKTGRVYFPPLEYNDIIDMEDESVRSRFFRLDSRLLVLTRSFYDGDDTYTAYYYLFDNGRFRLLRKSEERSAEN